MKETIMNIVTNEAVRYVVYLIFAVIASVVGGFLSKYLRIASEEALASASESRAASETERKQALSHLLDAAASLVEKCVAATNQLIVDNLKRDDKFDKDAQAAAFTTTYDNVIKLISDEARAAVVEMYGDFNEWLKLSIEAAVFEKKTATPALAEPVEAVLAEAVTGGDENVSN